MADIKTVQALVDALGRSQLPEDSGLWDSHLAAIAAGNALIAQMQRDAVQPAAVGEVNCFDKSGLPVIRLYPCAKNLRAGQEVFAAPHPEEPKP